MAKLFGAASTKRGPSLRGRVYFYNTQAGPVVATWPHKRRAPMTPDQLITVQLWKDAAAAMKRMDAGLVAYAMEAVKGSPYNYRDPLTAMLYGRACVMVLNDGTRLVPMAERIDTSQLLDNLAWTKGDILVRGESTWIALEPGLDGQVLTMIGTDAAHWATPTDPLTVISRQQSMNIFNAADAGLQATKGGIFTPSETIKVNAVLFGVSEVAGATYQASIFPVPVATLGVLVARSAVINSLGAGVRTRKFNISPEVTLNAGTRYGILHTRTDATAATSSGLQRGTDPPNGIIGDRITTGLTLASLLPVATNVCGTPLFQFWFGFQFHI